jgi:hypothetical protein
MNSIGIQAALTDEFWTTRATVTIRRRKIEGRIVEANDTFLHMVGFDREDLVSGRMRQGRDRYPIFGAPRT